MTPQERKETRQRRANAAQHLVAGAALTGAAAAGNALNDRSLERKGLEKPLRAARKKKLRPAHGRYLGVKALARAGQVVGIPMAAYGAYNLVKPEEKVPPVSPKRDVVQPIARAVTFRDARDEARARVGKRELSESDRAKLVRRKRLGRDLSIVGGTLGAAALGLRAPEVARAVATRSKRLAGTRPVKRLISAEPGATRVSNTLGIGAIGSGSVGSFNYASQQRLESKQLKKSLFRYGVVPNLGRVRVVGSPKKDYFEVVDAKDQRRWVPRSRITPVKGKGRKRSAEPRQLRLPFEKADDRFLRDYRDRISPDAERGYDSMRRQRNKDRAWAATQAGLTGVNAAGTAAALRARSAPFAALGAGLTAFSATQAVSHGRKARGYNKGPMEGIRRKARQREAAGVYGPGRGKEPVDETSRRVGKALVPRMPLPRSLPKGLARRPALRRSYVARRPSGRTVSVRGGFA